MNFELKKFPVVTELFVRSYELDFQGVVNNSVHFNYFEIARIDYFKKLYKENLENEDLILDKLNFFVVHNECDYLLPIRYNEKLKIYSRISFIKNSSFGFEHLIYSESQKNFVAKGGGVIVQFDKETQLPSDIDNNMINKIKDFDNYVEIRRENK